MHSPILFTIPPTRDGDDGNSLWGRQLVFQFIPRLPSLQRLISVSCWDVVMRILEVLKLD